MNLHATGSRSTDAPAPDPDAPNPLLGGLSPQRFMARHWQRRPLMVRQAWPGVTPPASRAELFELAGRESVESRCVEQGRGPQGWHLRRGPLARRALPPLSRPGWTLLVQGLDLHLDAAHRMLRAFDFLPQVRLDDLMLSYASDGGGVGPHLDSYDVFLLQVAGRRRWRISPPGDGQLLPGLPLRILARFEPQQEWVLEPGDLLYLPPGWGHDGVAVGGDCMTASIGFRAPTAAELVSALLGRLADDVAEEAAEELDDLAERGLEVSARPRRRRPRWSDRMTDPGLPASAQSGRIPQTLQAFAAVQVERLLRDATAIRRALGCWLTEPHPRVWFEGREDPFEAGRGVVLDRRTRVAHDEGYFFLNGEAYRIGGRDAALLRELADRRMLGSAQCRRLSPEAQAELAQWWALGWMGPMGGREESQLGNP